MLSVGSRIAERGALVGLLVIASSLGTSRAVASTALVAGPAAASSLFNKLEFLTFSGPVGLPGVTLVAGEYAFEVAHVDSGDVVRVRYRKTNRVSYMGFTHRIERPRSLAMDKSVILGEARAGEAAPILAWFPLDARTGYEFVYSAPPQ
jgi:hypothetical protein